jgi:hypothetical protein
MIFYPFKILFENVFLIYFSLFYMKIWPKMNIDLSWPCNIFLTWWWVFYKIVYILFINWLIDTMGYRGVSAVPVSKWKKNVSLSEWGFFGRWIKYVWKSKIYGYWWPLHHLLYLCSLFLDGKRMPHATSPWAGQPLIFTKTFIKKNKIILFLGLWKQILSFSKTFF